MPERNLKLFPLRVKDKLTHAEASEDGKHSFVPTKNEAVIPTGDNAYERTIRRHESLHAIYSPGKFSARLIEQVVEDLRLHLNHSEAEGAVRRDEIMSALVELRPMRNIEIDNWFSDAALTVLIRSMAILAGSKGKYHELINKVAKNIDCPHKEELGRSLRRAFKVVRETDSTETAIDILKKHFNKPDEMMSPADGSNYSSYSGITNPWYKYKKQGETEYEFQEIIGEISNDDPDLMSKQDKAKVLRLARGKRIPEFNIDQLFMSDTRNTDKGPQESGTFSGSKIRAKKLAAAAAAPSGVRLFLRKKPIKGSGTVLIDASGSMHLEDEHLKEIIQAMPSGTVAYYSGKNTLQKGTLTIVAQKGKQYGFPEGVRLPNRAGAGENVVDFEALSWLLKQDKPRYMVTDGEFCGSPLADECIPHKLLKNAIARGLVTQIMSVEHMKQVLKIE
jgi:hypothetical protein